VFALYKSKFAIAEILRGIGEKMSIISNFVELPDPTGEGVKPVDPTIVELEDGRLRLYYTYHSSEDEFARMSSSVAESIDDDFVYEDGVRLSVDGIHLLDPAVIYFDGTWHHFAQQNGRAKDGYFNYHSVSEDGLEFTREDDILLNTQMLGNPILANDGIRFYGSSDGKVLSAFSTDGYTWEMDKEARIEGGGDPAVVKLPDGNFLMAYTAY